MPAAVSTSPAEQVRSDVPPPDRRAERTDEYRRILGRYPTGVVVVAVSHEGRPYGMTVNSFTSVSLRPPLVLFCAAVTSTTWLAVRRVGGFAVSILAGHQEMECRTFADRNADRFAKIRWCRNRSGQPVLTEAVAWLDCRVEAVHPAGDHEIVVARVLDLREGLDTVPLVFHRGRCQLLAEPE